MRRTFPTLSLSLLTVGGLAFSLAACDAKEVTSDVATLDADEAEAIKKHVELEDGAARTTDASTSTDDDREASGNGSNAKADGAGKTAADGQDGKKKDDVHNLCADFKSCDECIAGLTSEGDSEAGAKAKCGLAVTGCWTTWDKPIRCGDEEYDERPS